MRGGLNNSSGCSIYFRTLGGNKSSSNFTPLNDVGIGDSKIIKAGPFYVQKIDKAENSCDEEIVIDNISKTGLLKFSFIKAANGGVGYTTNVTDKTEFNKFHSDLVLMDSHTYGANQFPIGQLYKELRNNPNSSKTLYDYDLPADKAGWGSNYIAFLGGTANEIVNNFSFTDFSAGWTNRGLSYSAGAYWYLNDQQLFYDKIIDWTGAPYEIPTNWGLGAADANWMSDDDLITAIRNVYQSGGAFTVPYIHQASLTTWFTFVEKGDKLKLKFTELYNLRIGTSAKPYYGWAGSFDRWDVQAVNRKTDSGCRLLAVQITDAKVY